MDETLFREVVGRDLLEVSGIFTKLFFITFWNFITFITFYSVFLMSR